MSADPNDLARLYGYDTPDAKPAGEPITAQELREALEKIREIGCTLAEGGHLAWSDMGQDIADIADALLSRRVEQEASTRRAVLAEVRAMVQRERDCIPPYTGAFARECMSRLLAKLDALTADPQENGA